MSTENPTGSGCLSMLLMIVVALFGGFGFLAARSTLSDVPPTPSEAVIMQFSADASAEQQQATVEIISQRLSALGVAPDVQLYPAANGNAATLRVLLPGGNDFQATLDLIRQPGDFELVDLSGLNATDYQDAQIWTTHQAEADTIRPDAAQLRPESAQPFTTVLDSSHVINAQATYDNALGGWTIQVNFDEAGGGLLGAFTAAHISEPLGIVVDGRVVSAPIVQSVISGEAVITGNFTQREARQLAAKIGFGALPIPLEVVSVS